MSHQEIWAVRLYSLDPIYIMLHHRVYVLVRIPYRVDAPRLDCEQRHLSIQQSCELGKSLHPAAQPGHKKNAGTRAARLQLDHPGIGNDLNTLIGHDLSFNCVVHAIDIPAWKSIVVSYNRGQNFQSETIKNLLPA